MLSFMEEQTGYFEVDGVGSIEEIAERIEKALGISES
jgi:adenylate kinase family enzyme